MVATDAKRFLETLTQDGSLRAKLASASVENLDAVTDFAMTLGYAFTVEDLKSALQSFPENPYLDQMRERWKVKATR